MENLDPQTFLEALLECYARANGLVLESLTLKRKDGGEWQKEECLQKP